jgi:hypothetical protein
MAGSGTAVLDFGAFPGKADATVAVTGQTGILSGSIIGAWILPIATADHSADEHAVEALKVDAEAIIAGTGFTIHGFAEPSGQSTRRYGTFTCAWAWA